MRSRLFKDLNFRVWEYLLKVTYLELSGTVSIERFLVDVAGESKRIEESGWGDNSKLVFVSHLDSRSAGGTLSWGEGGSRAEEGSEDGELHGGGLGYVS